MVVSLFDWQQLSVIVSRSQWLSVLVKDIMSYWVDEFVLRGCHLLAVFVSGSLRLLSFLNSCNLLLAVVTQFVTVCHISSISLVVIICLYLSFFVAHFNWLSLLVIFCRLSLAGSCNDVDRGVLCLSCQTIHFFSFSWNIFLVFLPLYLRKCKKVRPAVHHAHWVAHQRICLLIGAVACISARSNACLLSSGCSASLLLLPFSFLRFGAEGKKHSSLSSLSVSRSICLSRCVFAPLCLSVSQSVCSPESKPSVSVSIEIWVEMSPMFLPKFFTHLRALETKYFSPKTW